MRWKHEKAVIGGIRMKSGFLWLPLTIKGETRWLEFAVWSEVLKRGNMGDRWRLLGWDGS